MSSRVTVSIVTYNQTNLAMLCVSSVRKYSPDARLILTANGSTAAFQRFEQVPGAMAVFNKTNAGFGKPHNAALDHCDTEFMVCLNDDCIVGPKWIDGLLAAMADPKVALCGPTGACGRLDERFQ